MMTEETIVPEARKLWVAPEVERIAAGDAEANAGSRQEGPFGTS